MSRKKSKKFKEKTYPLARVGLRYEDMALPAGRAKVLGFQHDVSLTLELDPAVTVHETMESLRALGQFVEIAFQHLGEGIEH